MSICIVLPLLLKHSSYIDPKQESIYIRFEHEATFSPVIFIGPKYTNPYITTQQLTTQVSYVIFDM